MFKKLFNAYSQSQSVQYNWIRNHPVQYVALNASICAVIAGYMWYEDRQWKKAWKHLEDNKIPQQVK